MRLKALNLGVACQIFKCFSEEPRVRILHLIYKYEKMCIADLEEILEFTQTKTSRHANYLKQNGLLNVEKKDNWSFFYIKEDYQEIVNRFFSPIEKDQILLDDIKTFETLYANNVLALRKMHNKEKRYILEL